MAVAYSNYGHGMQCSEFLDNRARTEARYAILSGIGCNSMNFPPQRNERI